MSESLSPQLLESARRALRDERLAQTLAEHCPDLQADALDIRVHPECQMLGHSLRAHDDANLAISQYFAVALQQYRVVHQLIELLFDQPEDIEFLDFACGYGRLLRFLVHKLPPDRIHAAEIQADAVDWVRERYGINAFLSNAAPEDFEPNRRFNMVWAASLFSHLPDGLFGRWLERLADLLESDGVLCFSVHDEALLPPHLTMPEGGLCYLTESENADLDPEIYGTTFVTQAYVEAAIHRHLGTGVSVHRLPRLLAHEQDVYVLTKGERDLSSLDDFRRGTRGWLDQLRIDEDTGSVNLSGWAGSLDPVAIEGVDIRLEEHRVLHPAGEPRPDVADVLGYPGLADSGFSCTLQLPQSPAPWLSLSAVAKDGERALIYAGRLPRR